MNVTRLFARGTDTSRPGSFYALAAEFPSITVEVLTPARPSTRKGTRAMRAEGIRDLRKQSRELARQIGHMQRTTPQPSRRQRLLAAREATNTAGQSPSAL